MHVGGGLVTGARRAGLGRRSVGSRACSRRKSTPMRSATRAARASSRSTKAGRRTRTVRLDVVRLPQSQLRGAPRTSPSGLTTASTARTWASRSFRDAAPAVRLQDQRARQLPEGQEISSGPLKANGVTLKAYGSLWPVWEIDQHTISANRGSRTAVDFDEPPNEAPQGRRCPAGL